jgi:hypothetical protein
MRLMQPDPSKATPTMVCVNGDCKHFGIHYDVPVVELKRADL